MKIQTACSTWEHLEKDTLLALLWKPGIDEVQRMEILPTHSDMPNNGYFTVKVKTRETTPIYFTENTSANIAYINRAISPIAKVTVSANSYSQFLISFKNDKGQRNIPIITLVQNQLKYGTTRTGTVRITTKVEGDRDTGYGYSLLKSVPKNMWDITSFDPKSRTACIDLYNNNGGVTHLSVTVPAPI